MAYAERSKDHAGAIQRFRAYGSRRAVRLFEMRCECAHAPVSSRLIKHGLPPPPGRRMFLRIFELAARIGILIGAAKHQKQRSSAGIVALKRDLCVSRVIAAELVKLGRQGRRSRQQPNRTARSLPSGELTFSTGTSWSVGPAGYGLFL